MGSDIMRGRPPSAVGAGSLPLHERADFQLIAFRNIDVGDPRFVAPEAEDFRLGVNSPALSAFDLEGHPRAVDQSAVPDRYDVIDFGACERVDNGASGDTIFARGVG